MTTHRRSDTGDGADQLGRSVGRAQARGGFPSPAIDRALRDLDLIAGYVVGLACLRDPDAARPYREPTLDAERRAELDYRARLERAEATGIAPGEHTDAARADVLDVLQSVRDRAVDLAFHISRAARCPVMPKPTADGDPRPYLARTIACLPTAVTAWTNGSEIAWWAADVADEMLADITHALSLVMDGQRLKTVCPWCEGRTEMAPVGGERTWRVRHLPGDLLAIVCESGTCEPPLKDVGTWWRGRPCWPWFEWEWLADQLTAAEARAA